MNKNLICAICAICGLFTTRAATLTWSATANWFDSNHVITILSTTNVTYTPAVLAQTTNRIEKQLGSPLAALVLDNLALFRSSITDLTVVSADMLPPVTNWPVLAVLPGSLPFYTVAPGLGHRFFAGYWRTNLTLSLTWKPVPAPAVTGYLVQVGPQFYDAGLSTNYTAPVAPGQSYTLRLYCYGADGSQSVPSTAFNWRAPAVTNFPSPQFTIHISH